MNKYKKTQSPGTIILESRLPNQTIICVHLPNNADTLSLNCIDFASTPSLFPLLGTKHNLSDISLSNEKLIDFRKPFKIYKVSI